MPALMSNKLSKEEWMAELRRLAREKYGFSDALAKSLSETFLEYWEEGFDPDEALHEDLSRGL